MNKNKLKKIEAKMANMTPVYLIVCYAHWTVVEYKWTGKWASPNRYIKRPCPIVYLYDDHNGEYEEYIETPILNATTGIVFDWSFYKESANKTSELLEEKLQERLAKLNDTNV